MFRMARHAVTATLFSLLSFHAVPASARTVTYELTVQEKIFDITGRHTHAVSINGAIPGPVLRFAVGDTAEVRVTNRLHESTSIHWHGLYVPPGMDGVPYLSFMPIEPGATFIYRFPVRQAGTYWYHSHSGLQQQAGMYAPMVIDQPGKTRHAGLEHVVLLSDWSDEHPHKVLRTLKRGSEWYAYRKGNARSLLDAARLGMLGDYFKGELQRMPPMDISDVAYDRFLVNGQPDLTLTASAGKPVLMRVVDGSASTSFHLEFAGGPMNIMSADGQEVTPLTIQRLFIGPGETYDLLVQMPRTGSWELRATSIDGSGHTSIWLGEGSRHKSPDVPKPNMYHFMGKLALKQILAPGPASAMGMPDSDVEAGRFDNPGLHGMEGMEDMKRMDPMPGMDEHSGDDSGNAAHNNHQAGAMHEHGGPPPASVSETHENPNHGGMAPMHEDHSMIQQTVQESAAREVTTHGYAIDGSEPERPWPPYARLRAVSSTALPAAKPVRQIRLTLDGDMRRYIWSMGNKPLSESDDILIRGGETVRFILINRTMMHHPMHLHGHLFRVLNGQGDFAPLKHTVDVPPMSTVAIEFDANEPGNWFFHCHQLYHMESGMARVVHYEGFQTDPALAAARSELAMDEWYVQGTGHFSSNMTEGMLSLSNIRTTLRAEWEIGWAQVAGSHQEGLVTLERYQNGFTSFFAGARFEGDQGMTEKVRGVMGARYLLPLYLDSMIWVDTAGDVRLALAKELPLTSRLGLECEVQYDTQEEWKGATSLSYLLDRNFSLEGNWNSHYGFGAGLRLRF